MRLRIQLFKDVAYEHIILNTQQLCDPLRDPDLQRKPKKDRGAEGRDTEYYSDHRRMNMQPKSERLNTERPVTRCYPLPQRNRGHRHSRIVHGIVEA